MKRLFILLSLVMATNMQTVTMQERIAQWENAAKTDVAEVVTDVQNAFGAKTKPAHLKVKKQGPPVADKPECSICIDKITSAAITLSKKNGSCGHLFHKKCLGSSIRAGHDNCPICRTPLSDTEKRQLKASRSIRDLINSDYPPKVTQKHDWRGTTIKELNLASQEITSLDGLQNIPDIKEVEKILLGNNEIETIPASAFSSLNKLTSLDLGTNKIKTIHAGAFTGLGKLKYLFLNNNEIATIHDNAFNGLGELESLFLSNNEIATIHDNAFNGLDKLASLYLKSNKIRRLNIDVFNPLKNLDFIMINDNLMDFEDMKILEAALKLKYHNGIQVTIQ